MVCPSCFLAWGFLAAIVKFIYSKFFKKCCNEPEIEKKDWKKDVVYLYQFKRYPKMANLSPFCIKIEMFLRLNDIPYENCFVTTSKSKYGLIPFVELNGVHYADSQLIMEKLKTHFKIKSSLSPREESFARTLDRLADNHSFPVFMKFKALDEDFAPTIAKNMEISPLVSIFLTPVIRFFLRRRIGNRIFTSLGPFSDEEFHLLLRKDLDAYRDALGDQKYLMGDEPKAVDCAVFGQLVTLCFLDFDTEVKRLVRAEYPTLLAYQQRIISTVFPAEFA